MLRFLLDACGCFKQTTFYHQLEAQHLHERRRQEWGASRIPHLTLGMLVFRSLDATFEQRLVLHSGRTAMSRDLTVMDDDDHLQRHPDSGRHASACSMSRFSSMTICAAARACASSGL